jgi:hypothetical protein
MFYTNAYLSSRSQAAAPSSTHHRSHFSLPRLKLERTKSILFDAFSYSTVRSATIKSYKVGVIYRLAQLLLLLYIVGWELIYQKGYQATETVSAVVTTKVKGQGFVPVNKKRDKSLNKRDPFYYEKLFALNPNVTYKILDTAGKSN